MTPPPIDPCPSPGRWLAAALRPASSEVRSRLTAHMRHCERCRARFEVLRGLGYGSGVDPQRSPTPDARCAPDAALDAAADPQTALPDLDLLDHIGACPTCLTRLDHRMADRRDERIKSLNEKPQPPKKRWPWQRG